MDQITVKKKDLLRILKKNRDNHRAVFEDEIRYFFSPIFPVRDGRLAMERTICRNKCNVY